MKRTEKEAAQLIKISYHENGQGVAYECLACGYTLEVGVYLKSDHKEMIKHARTCEGNGKETDTQLAVLPAQQQGWRAIQLYDGEMIERLARRIKRCVPNGDRLNDNEALALAQIAVSTDLSPFVGELYYIPGRGPGVGIEGLRRKASEQSTYSMAPPRAMLNEEIAEHGLKEGDVGRVAELYRHDVLAKAVEINKAAGEPIIPIGPIVGVGIWKKGDQIPKGKSPAWMASKRAEADALKKGFNIVMPFHENGEWLPVMEDEEVIEAEVIRREAAVNAERHSQANGAISDYGDLIAVYKAGGRDLPLWVEEIKEAIKRDPKSSDPVDKGIIQQLNVSAQRKVTEVQFRAFVEIVLGNPLEDITFGGSRVLMNAINGKDFEAQVVSLLS